MLTKDTELGMIRYADAIRGQTHGRPGLNNANFELVRVDEDWVAARLPIPDMFELLRTPSYSTWQGEQWLFCCSRPMIFVGTWSRADFSIRASEGDGKALFESVVRDTVPGLWEDRLHDTTGIYVFRCQTCARHSSHWDIA
jgi:uncharacterized protein CbrC (UPF0167 family)